MTDRSAYLSVYEDWDFLRPSLESVAPFVDEIVVVDGAYKWMSGFVRANGRDPARSGRKVHDALANLGVPVRVIEGVWENEFEKRAAGYAACAHRYVFRLDADEIVFPDHQALRMFFDGGQAVAEMEIPPICHSPDWVEAPTPEAPIPRVGLVFDSTQIQPMDHLRYLWIVAKDWPAPDAGPLAPAAPRAVARTAHLAAWRSPEGARNRAAFYNLAYIRNYGCPWLRDIEGHPVADLDTFFARVDPVAFNASLLVGAQCCSDFDFTDKVLIPSPFSAEQRAIIQPHYAFFLRSHERRNLEMVRSMQWFVHGEMTRIDVTTPSAMATVAAAGDVQLVFSHPPLSARAELHLLDPTAPYGQCIALAAVTRGHALHIVIPAGLAGRPALRRLLRFAIWTREFDRLQQFRIGTAPSLG